MVELNPLYALLTQDAELSEIAHYRWGTVQEDGSVLLDTDTSPLADSPPTLAPYSVGDRVFVLLYQRRAVILGKAYPGFIAMTTTTTTVDPSATTTTTTSAG